MYTQKCFGKSSGIAIEASLAWSALPFRGIQLNLPAGVDGRAGPCGGSGHNQGFGDPQGSCDSYPHRAGDLIFKLPNKVIVVTFRAGTVHGGEASKISYVTDGFALRPICNFGTAKVRCKPEAGELPSPVEFIDVSKSDAIVKRPFATEGPDWKVIYPGLALCGVCPKATCVVNTTKKDDIVFASFGFGEHDLLTLKPACPMCSTVFVPKSPYFSKCVWRLNSVTTKGAKHSEPWREVKEGFETYKASAGRETFTHVIFDVDPLDAVQETDDHVIVAMKSCPFCDDSPRAHAFKILRCGCGYHLQCLAQHWPGLDSCPEHSRGS